MESMQAEEYVITVIVLNLSRYNCTVFPVIFWICLNHQVDLVIGITQEHVEK